MSIPNPTNFGRLRVASTPNYCGVCLSTQDVTRNIDKSYICASCSHTRAMLDANNQLLQSQWRADEGPTPA